MLITRLALCALAVLVFGAGSAAAQDSLRYYRLYLKDKGTPARVLRPGDAWYAAAAAHLAPRALARRAKVLPQDSLVWTDDLPLFQPYVDAITATGARIAQRSRWLNTAMVIADSATYEQLRTLPFLDSSRAVFARRRAEQPFGKRTPLVQGASATQLVPPIGMRCITELYGKAYTQNHAVRLDAAHRLGIAGEGVLVGVLDAGFDWRNHEALKRLNVIGEYDFVDDDSTAYDAEGQDAEGHGTAVMSMIGGVMEGVLVGGAPHASFLLAKTEDVRSERNVEEDNYVAGLEWLESRGTDVTNTSLGYTEFDASERSHPYSDLNGHTAHASRGINHATRLGMLCVVAAGNEGAHSYRYVSVPGEADSAIAVAAVDSNGVIASFSSRGFGPRSNRPGPGPMKPDVAAMGVANWGADHANPTGLITGQGTSYASPMTTAVVALMLSARPDLRPWEVRDVLYRTSSRALAPDTAYGHGVINLDSALWMLSHDRPIVGLPSVVLDYNNTMRIAAGVRYAGGMPTTRVADTSNPAAYLELRARPLHAAGATVMTTAQPFSGLALWATQATIGGTALAFGDSLELTIVHRATGATLRRDTVRLRTGNELQLSETSYSRNLMLGSVLCELPLPPATSVATAVPNPFHLSCVIQYQVNKSAQVSLVVYNTLGQEVARPVQRQAMDAGFYTAFFQPHDLPSGTYYYLLSVDDATVSGELVYFP